jgi:hypothetical protein
LDLSLRNGPITPPSTPSPPRKKVKKYPTESLEQEYRIHSSSSQFIDTISDNDRDFANNKYTPSSYLKIFSETNVFNSVLTSNVSNDKHVLQNENSEDESSCDDIIDITDCSGDNVITLTNLEILNDKESNEAKNYESSNDDEFVDVVSHDSNINCDLGPNYAENRKEDQPVLENGKMHFDNPKYHTEAIEGFAKLFEKDFGTTFKNSIENTQNETSVNAQKICKPERRRIKSRKQILDEENTSPVSGTIIRKLLEGEELVVRKGDIDPCFNVVEVTEEAKANLGKNIFITTQNLYKSLFDTVLCPNIDD